MKEINYIKVIDIAHPPLNVDDIERLLDQELMEIRNSKNFRALKVIHGYGSTSGGYSVSKEVVKNWCFRNRSRIIAIIPGETYSIYDHHTQEMRKKCGQIKDIDLGMENKGITIIWIK